MADKPGDRLIQISTAFQRYGEPEPYARTVVCLGETDDVEGCDITWHAEEHRVIESWAMLLREHKADVLIGYNTFQVRLFQAETFGKPSLTAGAVNNEAQPTCAV